MMVYAEKDNGIFIAIKEIPPISEPPGISHRHVHSLTVTSAKTKDTFNKIGSDRQCCVEILAFSEIVRVLNPTIEFVVLIKACKSTFQIYIYFTRTDLLVRTTQIALTDANHKAKIMLYF